MKESDWELEKMKWILDSIGYINSKKPTNYDALLLGGFSGSIIEFLGRCLRDHVGYKKGIHKIWYDDFLRRYMQKYLPYSTILYNILRCEGAHDVLAQSGVGLSADESEEEKFKHLKGFYNVSYNRKYLFISSPIFLEDLKTAVENFFSEVDQNKVLEGNCRKTLTEVFEYGQKIMGEEEMAENFKIDYIIP